MLEVDLTDLVEELEMRCEKERVIRDDSWDLGLATRWIAVPLLKMETWE